MSPVSGEDETVGAALGDSGGVSADETVRRPLGEHFQHRAVLAMDRYREEDPEGWQEYLAGAADPWVE